MHMELMYYREQRNANSETEPENTKIIYQFASIITPATNGIIIEAIPFTMTTLVRNYALFS